MSDYDAYEAAEIAGMQADDLRDEVARLKARIKELEVDNNLMRDIIALQPMYPDDWKLVPIEPTTEMMRAGAAVPLTKAARHNAVYRAMLSAAPKEE